MKNDNEKHSVAYCTDDELDPRIMTSQTLLPYQVGEFNRAVFKTDLFVMMQYPHPAEYYVEQNKRNPFKARRKRCFSNMPHPNFK